VEFFLPFKGINEQKQSKLADDAAPEFLYLNNGASNRLSLAERKGTHAFNT
jgi:hypothetical protein